MTLGRLGILAVVLASACARLPDEQPRGIPPLSGRVETFALPGRTTQAVMTDVADGATVSLIAARLQGA